MGTLTCFDHPSHLLNHLLPYLILCFSMLAILSPWTLSTPLIPKRFPRCGLRTTVPFPFNSRQTVIPWSSLRTLSPPMPVSFDAFARTLSSWYRSTRVSWNIIGIYVLSLENPHGQLRFKYEVIVEQPPTIEEAPPRHIIVPQGNQAQVIAEFSGRLTSRVSILVQKSPFVSFIVAN